MLSGTRSPMPARRPHLGPYALGEALGVGGMSVVFAATHAPSGAPVALKVHTTTRPDEVAGVSREALVAASLSHPAIVRVLDVGRVDRDLSLPPHTLSAGAPFVVMERVSGPTLAANLPDTWEATREALAGVLDALAHAHARGVVHCDIKPSNILIDPQTRRPRLTDFGVASVLDMSRLGRDPHAVGGLRGTPAYMAPEQFGPDGDRGPWTDLYALGCLTWRLVTGAPPFGLSGPLPALARDHRDARPQRFQPTFDVPPGLEAWTRRLLAKPPRARFQRAADAAWALAQLGPAVDVEATATPSSHHAPGAPTFVPATQTSTDPFGETMDAPSPPPSSRVRPTPPTAAHEGASLPPGPAPFPPTPPPSSAAHRGPGAVGPAMLRTAPFLGREAERHLLWDALASVAATGRPRAVVIAGPPGVGKSALAAWLLERAHAAGAAEPVGRLAGRVDEARTDLGRAFTAWLHGDVRPASALEADLRERLQAAGEGSPDGRLEQTVAALLTLLLPERSADAALPRVRLFGQAQRRALLARLLRVAAHQRPAVLWVDDLRPGDPTAEDLAALLAQPRLEAPALFVVTTATSTLPALLHVLSGGDTPGVSPQRPEGAMSALTLSPLSRSHRARLYETLSGHAPAPGIVDGATTLEVVQRALLCPGDPGTSTDLPTLWRARRDAALAGASPDARASVELAAALGPEVRDVEWRVVCAHAGIAPDADAVARLAVAGLVRYVDGGWVFAHPSLHRALWAELAAQGALGERLEHVAQGLAGLATLPVDGRLRQARAAAASGDVGAGRRGLLAAARRLHTLCRWAEAQEVLAEREALAPGATLETIRDDEQPDRPGPEDVEALLLKADIDRLRWRFEAAARTLERAQDLAEALGHPPSERAALLARGRLSHWVGDTVRARRELREADALFAAAGDEAGRAACALELISVEGSVGDLDAASAAANRALGALDETAADRTGRTEPANGNTLGAVFLGQVLEARGSLKRRRGDPVGARADARRARDAYHDAGYLFGVASAINLLAETLRLEGHCEQAEPMYRQAAALWREAGSHDDIIADIGHVYCVLAREDVGAARAELERLAAALEGSGQRGYLPYTLGGLVLCDALEGEDVAPALARAQAELAARPLVDPDLAWAFGRAARALREAGQVGALVDRLVELEEAARGSA